VKPGQRLVKGPLPWILGVLLILWIGSGLYRASTAPAELTWSEFQQAVEAGELQGTDLEVTTVGNRTDTIEGARTTDGASTPFVVRYSPQINDEQLRAWIASGRIASVQFDPEQPSLVSSLLITVVPFILILGIFFLLIQNMQGGGGRVMQFGRSKAKRVTKDTPKVTFDDVAGAESAVEELKEIVEFLGDPQRFIAMGAKIPRGVLLFGPPGTGKTLIAKAVAGEAGVPFFTISGSDFVEMFVGVGASRVRDLFEQAKQNAPAIIFMDEIDAVGRHRGAGLGGGHDEREQTLNQLLVEMDGFDSQSSVILIAATNRPDILDPALLRPGRFDRQVVVDRPDLAGRRAILAVHAKGKPLADDVNLDIIARQTPGFTGADLANLLNEAALLSARHGRSTIDMEHIEGSIIRVIAGPERRTRLMDETERRTVAFHESGHAIVGHALPNADPVHRITIIPRGQALGYTMQLPTQDRYLVRRAELIDRLAVMLGGRVAEELRVGDITTGAGDDIKRATATAREMVTQYGMSDTLGPIVLGQKDSQPFLGRDLGHQADYSGQVAFRIDEEIRGLIDEAHDEALEILVENADVLDALTELLLEVETVEGEQLEQVFAPIRQRTSRAVPVPTDADPAAVIDRLRRVRPTDDGLHHPESNGAVAASSGPASAASASAGPQDTTG
jgi:cell division protease FtsH